MSTVEAFRSHYDRKVAINTAYCVAHGAVRLETVGFRDMPLIGGDLARAQRLIAEGIEQGAVGFSTGMSYYPNAWSDTAEDGRALPRHRPRPGACMSPICAT